MARSSYTLQFKAECVECLKKEGMPSTLSRFFPSASSEKRESVRKMIYKWRSAIDKIESTPNWTRCKKRKLRPKGVTAVLPRSIEENLFLWVCSLRQEGIPVARNLVRMQALSLAAEMEIIDFRASYNWLNGFLSRFHLSMRMGTKKAQELPSSAEMRGMEFAVEVKAMVDKLGVDRIYNADQTAVFFEMLPKNTIDQKAAATVWVKSCGFDKERVSCMLLGDSLGNKFSPTVVFKMPSSKTNEIRKENWSLRNGFGRRCYESLAPVASSLNIDIFCNQNGWFTEDIIIQWLKRHFQFNPSHKKLLLLDGFSAHKTKRVAHVAEQLGVTLMFIPPGLTSVSQPADLAWNAPFKGRLRNLWVDRMIRQLKTWTGSSEWKLSRPTREETLHFIDKAWRSLSESTIQAGFSKARLLNASLECENSNEQPDGLGYLIDYLEKTHQVHQLDMTDGEADDDGGNSCNV